MDRGLSVADLDDLTVAQLLDYLTTCNNEDAEAARMRKMGVSRRADAADLAAW